MAEDSRGHMPSGRWEFDAAVTDVFEDMLQRSIPQYDVMRSTVHMVARDYVRPGCAIVDLGCSRGGALASFVDEYGIKCRYVGVDVSEPMLEAARARFEDMPGVVDIRHCDLTRDYPDVLANVTLLVLTLQFTPINYRAAILRNVYEHTMSGGALLLVEKVLGDTAETEELLVRHYHASKVRAGYTQDEIDRKRASLEGVLVPCTANGNERMLEKAGFRHVECVWRWMSFACWVAIK